MSKKIYIVGHKKPDLDAIASAVGYEAFRHALGHMEYGGIRCDRVNELTKWVFNKYNTEIPPLVEDVSNLNLVLVDHTFQESRPKGWERANILEVIDHHDVKLEDIIPRSITIRPCGSTCSLISEMFFKKDIQVPQNIAYILLSGILDDSLGLKSPTTIQLDRDMVNQLNEICKIGDIWEYSKKLFKMKDIWHKLTPREIIEEDLRYTNINGNWISISQVETVNNGNLPIDELVEELKRMNEEKEYPLRTVMLTNPLENSCTLLVVGKDIKSLEKELNKEILNNRVFLEGVVSRKKQVLPLIERIYS
jgi:manganese-dependent inorganic pyrophosphatase